jgi:phage-related protein
MIFSDEFDRLLALLIQEYFRCKHKAINYTDTYTRKSLLEGMLNITKRVLYNHCIEVQVDKHKVADDYHEWLEKNVDRLAKEEVEFKSSLNKPYRVK